jgi:xanthine dehydrogenase YagS FAD-binding subunit
MMPPFAYVRPGSLKEAFEHLQGVNAHVHAGGTDLLGCLREEIFEAHKLVSITGLQELHGVARSADGGLRIGALTTVAEVSENPLVRERYPGLARGASEVASPQLRNQGTIGGNLCQKPRCWYYRGEFQCLRKGGATCFAARGENQFHCLFGSDERCYIVHPSDTAPPLAALKARVEIAGPDGRRQMPVEEFHVLPADDVKRETWLEPGEILTAVHLPPPSASLRSSYRKVRARRSWDFALAGVALALNVDGDQVIDGRVVLSGAAPVPWRSRPVEEVLRGRKLGADTIEAAAEAVVEEARPLEKNAYKLALFGGVVREELEKIKRPAP